MGAESAAKSPSASDAGADQDLAPPQLADPAGRASLRSVLAQLAEGVIVADAVGRVTFVNEAAARLHGVARLEVTPPAYAEAYRLFTEDGRPYPSTELPLARAVLRGETVVDARWRIRRPDGSEVAAVGSARPVLDDDGVQVGAVLTVRDDTERTAAAAAMRERDFLAGRLRAAFEQSPVSTVVYDATGRPLAANPAFERLWGAGMADVPPDYSLLTDRQLAAAGVLPLVRRAFEGEAVTLPALRYEMAGAVGRGAVRWTEGHLHPVRDASGAVEQVVLTHEDVTAQREADAIRADTSARAERQQALSAALSTASTVDEVVQAVVTHAAAILGAVDTVVARLTENGTQLEIMRTGAMPDDIRDEWRRFPIDARAPLADVARTGEPIFIESRDEWAARYPDLVALLHATGHHANAVTPLVVDGHVLGVLGAAFDAPHTFGAAERARALGVALQCAQALERARLLEAERAARTAAEAARAEAERANRAKGEFLAVMSHELRTPLNAILGYAQLLEMGVLGPATPAQHAHLERLQASARHLLRLVNDVLDVAKADAERLEVRRDALFTGAAVSAAVTLVQPQAAAKGVRLVDAGAGGSGVPFVGDEHRVRQVLVNLLANAVKFTPVGGEVTVACGATAEPEPDVWRPPARDALARADGPASWAFVRVTDTGLGMAPELLHRLFEPFVQGDGALTREQGGTGLGLAISRRLARLMGGDVTVRSELGAGATFTLWLPGCETAAPVEGDRRRAAPPAEPTRVPPPGYERRARRTAPLGTAAITEPPGPPLDDAAYAALYALSIRLAGESEAIAERYVAALRADGSFPGARELSSVQLRDHVTPFVGLIAAQLMIIGETHGRAPELLRDGGQVQRLMAELHGAQRYRLGWDEGDLEREARLLLDEVERAVQEAVRSAAASEADAAARDAASQYAAVVMRHVVEQGAHTALRAHRAEKAADAP